MRFSAISVVSLPIIFIITPSKASIGDVCLDEDSNCYAWVAENHTWCDDILTNTARFCDKSCRKCGGQYIHPEFDLRKVPQNLEPIAFLLGVWRSEFGGKAFFPTIPKFTYGEEIVFRLCNNQMTGDAAFNYTAFAWDNNDLKELHSEYGYITVKNGTNTVAMNTVMSNGFITIESGYEEDNAVKMRMRRIGRINFSRDLPVRRMFRSWTLLDPTHLEARLSMGTITHRLMEHTSVIYERTYP